MSHTKVLFSVRIADKFQLPKARSNPNVIYLHFRAILFDICQKKQIDIFNKYPDGFKENISEYINYQK
ncbi:MAG: hypothetical protein CMQ26_05170, partial [Gammaproteobacteria bacterium]|nr:hypothetical protein [Gammaproteobacteria bacterium]